MSATTNLISVVLFLVAGAILLVKKWPEIQQNLAIKKELARIEREAYLNEAVKTAQQKGIQRARSGLLPAQLQNLGNKLGVSQATPQPKPQQPTQKKGKHVKKKRGLNLPGVNINLTDGASSISKPQPEQKDEEFSNMKKLMGVNK